MCVDDGESQQWTTGPAPVVQQATPRSVCLCVFTGWSHCSQVKVTVNKRETKPERRRHLTVCECEKNRDRKGEEDKEKKNTNKLISCLF